MQFRPAHEIKQDGLYVWRRKFAFVGSYHYSVGRFDAEHRTFTTPSSISYVGIGDLLGPLPE